MSLVKQAAQQQKQVLQEEDPSPVSTSKASSFCSFDVRIWEELHLKSLSSVSSPVEKDQQRDNGGQLLKREKKECKSSVQPQGFSFFSSSARSGLSSPHRLSNASSTTGYASIHSISTRDNTSIAPPLYKSEKLPVVKVVQTGTMSFTSEELVLQLCGNTDDPHPQETSAESPLLEDKKPPLSEEEDLITEPFVADGKSNEKSVVLGSLSKVNFLQNSAPDVYSAPIPPLKPAGAIPFKWEEAPGKPKPCTDSPQSKLTPSLQLPPKLLYPSFSLTNCTSPYCRSQSKHTASSSPSSLDNTASKPTLARSLWHSFMQSGRRSYREDAGKSRLKRLMGDEEPWSPTSTLLCPDAGLSSSSSTSSTLDALCTSPGLPDVQSSRSTFNMDDATSCPPSNAGKSFSPSYEASSLLAYDLPNLAPSMERKTERPLRRKATDRLRGFLKSCQKWRSLGSQRKRNHEEAEMWSPTLATYFHSMELERSSSVSGQSLLLEEKSIEKQKYDGNPIQLSSTATIDVYARNGGQSLLLEEKSIEKQKYDGNPIQLSSTATIDVYARNGSKGLVSTDALQEDMVVFSAKSTMRNFTVGHKGKKSKLRRRAGGWVLRKLRRSSRFLAAIWRVMAKSTRDASTKKSKRRKLPYQHINW